MMLKLPLQWADALQICFYRMLHQMDKDRHRKGVEPKFLDTLPRRKGISCQVASVTISYVINILLLLVYNHNEAAYHIYIATVPIILKLWHFAFHWFRIHFL